MPFWKILIFASIIASIILIYASQWKVFQKAGKPGWASIVPFYNTIVILEIIGRPWWWLLLLLFPVINIIITFIMVAELARRFGKGTIFALGMALFPFIFWPILGFGNAEYEGFEDEEYEDDYEDTIEERDDQ